MTNEKKEGKYLLFCFSTTQPYPTDYSIHGSHDDGQILKDYTILASYWYQQQQQYLLLEYYPAGMSSQVKSSLRNPWNRELCLCFRCTVFLDQKQF